jgi:nitrous oxide reductase accessory protein NosL
MSDDDKGSAAMLGYGYAGRFLLGLAVAALLAAGCETRNDPPPKPKKVVTVCSGCGTEWWSQDGKPSKPITKCPNCPMSEKELEELIEQMRKRTENP